MYICVSYFYLKPHVYMSYVHAISVRVSVSFVKNIFFTSRVVLARVQAIAFEMSVSVMRQRQREIPSL